MDDIFFSNRSSKKLINIFFNNLKYKKLNENAFALPQILVLAIGISITLVGLMNVSINRLY